MASVLSEKQKILPDLALSLIKFLLCLVLRQIIRYDTAALRFPLGSIGLSVVQVFIARNAKHAALLQLLGQRNDVKVEKAQLALIPALRRILV